MLPFSTLDEVGKEQMAMSLTTMQELTAVVQPEGR